METKSCHNANFVITGGTTGCHNNLWCHQWWQSHQLLVFSVFASILGFQCIFETIYFDGVMQKRCNHLLLMHWSLVSFALSHQNEMHPWTKANYHSCSNKNLGTKITTSLFFSFSKPIRKLEFVFFLFSSPLLLVTHRLTPNLSLTCSPSWEPKHSWHGYLDLSLMIICNMQTFLCNFQKQKIPTIH